MLVLVGVYITSQVLIGNHHLSQAVLRHNLLELQVVGALGNENPQELHEGGGVLIVDACELLDVHDAGFGQELVPFLPD